MYGNPSTDVSSDTAKPQPTVAMQAALNILGYTCYHSIQFFNNVRDCAMWNEAMDAKFRGQGRPFTRADWDQLLGHCSAVSSDPPAVAFAEDLIAAYPDAKVVLVEREVESWYKSFDANVIEPMWNKLINLIAACDPFLLGPVAACHHRWARWWLGATGKKEMQAKARDKYREHYALVRKVTPPGMLLEYRMGDGWEPLCEFLGKPVPDVPFPRRNDEAVHKEQMAVIVRKGLRNVLRRATTVVVGPLLGIVLAWWLWGSKLSTTVRFWQDQSGDRPLAVR